MSKNDSKVIGHNTDGSGETYGVWGEVDSASGYGLGTPGDVRIDGAVDGGGEWTVEVQDGSAAGNVVQGDPSNSADAGSEGQSLSGGESNATSANYATIGGGLDNSVSEGRGTVAGGKGNDVSGSGGTVGGGWNNVANDTVATVGGGEDNEATGANATVGGGEGNLATENYATIAGGGRATFETDSANHVYDRFGTIGGGGNNRAGLSGGTAEYATVSGGMHNDATGESAAIGGGWDNTASGTESTVGGGDTNEATGGGSTVGGGIQNAATDFNATVAGGRNNNANEDNSTIAGGKDNVAQGTHSTVGGGLDNSAGGWCGVVPGGAANEANGEFSFAVGREGHADHDGSMVFADSTSTVASSGSADEARFQMTIVAENGVDDQSARAAKTNVKSVDPARMLDGVRSLDVASWEYRDGDGGGDGRTHVGPMAEDFHAAFDVGGSAETISSIDRDGVALAAIQELADRLEEREERVDELAAETEILRDAVAAKDDRIDAMSAENAELRDCLTGLEERIAAIEAESTGRSLPAED